MQLMSTPTVTEIRLPLEAVVHDTFIDDLAPSRVRTAVPARDAEPKADRRARPSRRSAQRLA
jgi:hypothetical protein